MLKEYQYTSPNTSRELKNIGICKKADYYWRRLRNQYILVPQSKYLFGIYRIPAFSLAELGEMIPWGFFQAAIVHKMPGNIWQVKLSDGKMHNYALEVEARAWYLIDLIKNGQVKVVDINPVKKTLSVAKPS